LADPILESQSRRIKAFNNEELAQPALACFRVAFQPEALSVSADFISADVPNND